MARGQSRGWCSLLKVYHPTIFLGSFYWARLLSWKLSLLCCTKQFNGLQQNVAKGVFALDVAGVANHPNRNTINLPLDSWSKDVGQLDPKVWTHDGRNVPGADLVDKGIRPTVACVLLAWHPFHIRIERKGSQEQLNFLLNRQDMISSEGRNKILVSVKDTRSFQRKQFSTKMKLPCEDFEGPCVDFDVPHGVSKMPREDLMCPFGTQAFLVTTWRYPMGT